MSRIPVSTINASTDAYSSLTVAQRAYTTASLQIRNASTRPATFRIKTLAGALVTQTPVDIAGSGVEVHTMKGLVPGSSQDYILERLESGTYVQQSATATERTTLAMANTAMTISVGTTAALVQWPVAVDVAPVPEFVLLLQTTADFAANITSTAQLLDVPSSVVATTYSRELTGLLPQTDYTVVLMIRDRTARSTVYPDGFGYTTLDMKTMTTAVRGTMTAALPKASRVDITWTGSSTDTFRIVDATGAIIIPEMKGGSSATVWGLLPGQTYNLVLQMKENGQFQQQAAVSMTTPSTQLTVNSEGSTRFQAQWTAIYTGAQYVITVVKSGDSTVVREQQLTENRLLLTDLAAQTNYIVALYVLEEGERVPLGTATLGTGDDTTAATTTGTSTTAATTTGTSTTASSTTGGTPPPAPAATTATGASTSPALIIGGVAAAGGMALLGYAIFKK